MLRSVLTLALLLGGASFAHANSPGLNTEEVNGVKITRGRAIEREATVPAEKTARPASTMRLADGYRGAVFGGHKIVREGRKLQRRTLNPIRQRDDE